MQIKKRAAWFHLYKTIATANSSLLTNKKGQRLPGDKEEKGGIIKQQKETLWLMGVLIILIVVMVS